MGLGETKPIRPTWTPAERKILQRITRSLPALRTLRQIMDQAYGLFDRRCRTETARAKLARLRQRVARFKHLHQTLNKLFSPNWEKALTFLDDSLLPVRKAGIHSLAIDELDVKRLRVGELVITDAIVTPSNKPAEPVAR